ncbi:lysozyme inhibitor LprI family protein [Burkholderia multivorans]|uniref:lysozyme inhibitor LprI family protein n=1 Tax=Burkholderia multivorans TaxID=87883 RepID=UPI000A7339D9|nr:lysozyme inhibitor LprI family protein [Burkholderia multivorans]
MKTVTIAALLLAVSTAAFADGPAFNCAKASSKVEKMICGDSALAGADSVNADLYKEVLQASDNPNLVKQEQRQWLKVRNACQSLDCLAKAYNDRYNALEHERRINSGAINADGSVGH